MNDSDLVRGLREQDPAAIRHLSECHLPSVWRFVYVRVNDRHLAEDIVSETVTALVVAAADPAMEIRNPGAWMRSVAANKVNNHFRAAARVRHLVEKAQPPQESDGESDPAKRQELEERRAEVRQAMDVLPDQHRSVLEWKYIDKLSVRDIAQRLAVTEKAAESILFRARRDLKNRLVDPTNSESSEEEPPPRGHPRQSTNNDSRSVASRLPVNNEK